MIKLKVNGKNHQFNGDMGMPLLWVLRDELTLKGTNANQLPREDGNK